SSNSSRVVSTMRLPLLLLLAVSTTSAENSIDISTLFSAGLLPLTPCTQPCLTDLIHATREILYFKDTLHHFQSLCSTYDNASLCVSQQEVACGHSTSFAANSDPVNAMCNRKWDALAPLVPCVEKAVDGLLSVCDSSCLFTSSLSEMSRRESVRRMAEAGGDNRFALVAELSSLCPASSCMLSCMAKSLNAACPPAGDDIIGAILRPFHVYAEMLEADEVLKSIVFKVAPPTCYPFLVEDGLEKMQAGEYAKEESGEEASADLLESHRSMDAESDYFQEDAQDGLSTLLSASGLPQCTDACLSDLLLAANKIFDFNNTLHNFEQLCSTYDNASLCVASQEIECVHMASFAVGASGLEEICKTKKEQFARHSSCLSPHIDSALSSCDITCQLTSSVSRLIDSPTILESAQADDRIGLYQEIAPLCPSMGCMVSCIARSLNRYCAPAGSEIAESLLRPFVKASELLISLGPEEFDTVRATLPSACHIFVSLTDLADMVEGVESSKWASPSEVAALAVEEAKEREMEESIIVGMMQEQQAEESLLAQAVLQDLETQQQLQRATSDLQQVQHDEDDHHELQQQPEPEVQPDESVNWGRPGQIPRSSRMEFAEI
ncbi:hypothetical protein PFISCL1PPCAC_1317, partial [Pristionchus fissidentatus]